MEQLARASGVAVGSIYNHFESDLEIYAALAREDLDDSTSDAERVLGIARRYMPEELAAVFR